MKRVSISVALSLILGISFGQTASSADSDNSKVDTRNYESHFRFQVKQPMTRVERFIRKQLRAEIDKVFSKYFIYERHDGKHGPKIKLRPGISPDTATPPVRGKDLESVKIVQGNPSRILLNFDYDAFLAISDPAGYNAEEFWKGWGERANGLLATATQTNPDTYLSVDFLFEGYDREHYNRSPGNGKRGQLNRQNPLRATAAQTILVSAGHGIRYLPASGTWEFQRVPQKTATGATYYEDRATPDYADSLRAQLVARSAATVTLARNPLGSATTYVRRVAVPDGNNIPLLTIPKVGGVTPAWRDMAAKYNLETLLAGPTGTANQTVWNSTSAVASRNDEWGKDRRSRPYYAGYLGFNAMISIHTNAAPVAGTAKGGRVYYDTNNSAGAATLADKVVACLTKRGAASYPGYAATLVPDTGNYGELTEFAAGPNIIVEVAFHDNPLDLNQLINPAFRQATMAGVEQGWRDYALGLTKGTCAP